MHINFITSESLSSFSGGWNGNSYQIFRVLQAKSEIKLNYIGPVKPSVSILDKCISKGIRLFQGKSSFYYFSEKRLQTIANEVHSKLMPAEYYFFMGSTPWINLNPKQPYGAYLDACFLTYFKNNLNKNEFSWKDIDRICEAEKIWIENARHIFWASSWAKDEAVQQYGLSNHNHFISGIGGNLEIPYEDHYRQELLFLFIAQNFNLKGGPLMFEVFKAIQRKFQQAQLIILGECPPQVVLNHPGVFYPGYLHKNDPEEYQQFKSILSRAFCLIHPTNSDTIGQVIIEAGYFGCPAIAPAIFAIPEIIQDNKTGFLVKTPFTKNDFFEKIEYMIDNPDFYKQMRQQTREHCIRKFSYQSVGDSIMNQLIKL